MTLFQEAANKIYAFWKYFMMSVPVLMPVFVFDFFLTLDKLVQTSGNIQTA
ncbi:MAG: hypothetical protein GY862_05080 [Gammaproteobacteria bacterium]|nr:hypothetical protein [Gammaproteobacteria bacterium]